MARWKNLLRDSLSKSMKENKDSVTYCLSTVSRIGLQTDDKQGYPTKCEYLPESRMVVHRGFVNERRRHDNQGEVSSEEAREDNSSESLLVCTDVRSPKVDQLLLINRPIGKHSSSGSPALQSGPLASICWWFAPTGEQYRIQARAYVVSAEMERGRIAGLTAEQTRRLGPPDGVDFGWEAERVRIYEKLSWELKASFVGHSAPGSKFIEGVSDKASDVEKRLEQGDKGLRETALRNFALIILEPVSIDLVQLKTDPHQRLLWKKTSSGNWEESKLAP